MATSHERALAAEWLIVMVMETGDALAKHGKQGKRFLPQPSRYFATMVAYLMLAGVALFGEKAGKVAAALGALVALTIVMAPPTIRRKVGPTNEPLLVSFLGYLSKMMATPPGTIREPLHVLGPLPKKSSTGAVNYTTQTDVHKPLPYGAGYPYRHQQPQGGR